MPELNWNPNVEERTEEVLRAITELRNLLGDNAPLFADDVAGHLGICAACVLRSVFALYDQRKVAMRGNLGWYPINS